MTNPLVNLLAIVIALTAPAAAPAQPIAVPFEIGERLTYDVKFGKLKVGTGRMEVLGIEEVRGLESWHTVFHVKGGTFFYRVDDRFESWIDTRTFSSLRHVQDIKEGRRDRQRNYEIYPDRRTYTENENDEVPTVQDPLDDGSFLYFIRTMPLSVGQTYEFPRYFKPDRNPVKVRVLRRETVEVPAGRFDAIVLQPIIKAKGIFSENGQAEIWLSDDDKRIMVQLKSNLSFGSLNLYLKSFHPGTATASKMR